MHWQLLLEKEKQPNAFSIEWVEDFPRKEKKRWSGSEKETQLHDIHITFDVS